MRYFETPRKRHYVSLLCLVLLYVFVSLHTAPIIHTDHACLIYVSNTDTSVFSHDNDTLSIILPHLNIPQSLTSVPQAFGDMRFMLDFAARDVFG